MADFALPDLGEGLTEAEILRWLVAVGDRVTLNQPIVEVETAKAAVEIPSPYAGVVKTLHHSAGDTIDVGAPLISFDVEGESGTVRPEGEQPAEFLVGSGPKPSARTRRARVAPVAPMPPVVTQADRPQPARVAAAAVGERAERLVAQVHVLAKPPVRKLARDLGVDLRVISGTGAHATITRADVEAAAAGVPSPGGARSPVGAVIDVDPATRERRIPIKGVRKATAAAMVQSAFTAPQVSEFVTVDVTPMMELVTRLRAHPDFDGIAVSPLLLVARSLVLAIARHPMINSSWDDEAQEIVVKDYINLGIATATERGLIVPNIKDAGRLSLPELGAALNRLVASARAGRATPSDLSRGTVTITNVGVFGVDTGTPILNPGEAAILCFGAVRDQPWVHEGRIEIRNVTQLAVTFDHRIVDGQLGSEFLADVAGQLADPWQLVTWR